MKIGNMIKKGVYTKLASAVEHKITLREFTDVFLFLDDLQTIGKIIPYRLFENRAMLRNSNSGLIFDAWVEAHTGNIEKDFNKGRKLVRVLKDKILKNDDTLPFNLVSESVFLTMLRVFLLESSYMTVNNKSPEFSKNLGVIRDYMTAIFVAELLFESELNETMVYKLLIVPTSEAINVVKSMGVEQYGKGK